MKKKSGSILVKIIVAVIVIITALVVVVFSVLNKVKNADYYSIGKDQVPAVKLVVGKRKVSGVSTSTKNGVTTKRYEYSSDSSYEDIESYYTYLVEKAGYQKKQLDNAGDVFYYGINSVENGKVIILKVDVNPYGYTINITKGDGTWN